MRNFELPGKSEVFGRRGMVATAHPQATLAALEVLKAGGNAVDAAIAAAALLAVIEPSQTGIGGDCFALIKKRGKPVLALEGAGWSPKNISVDALTDRGALSIDPFGAHAVTVPGAVRAWSRLAQDHGSLEWRTLLKPAILAANEGVPVTERLARDWGRNVAKLSHDQGTARTFLRQGQPYTAGQLHVQKELAAALESIASDGANVFYEGWIARDILAKLKQLGGTHSDEDFALWQPRYVEPISVNYRGYQLWECPPPGQGIVTLLMAAMLEQKDLASMDPMSPQRFHLLTEFARLAYAERDHHLSDVLDPSVLVAHMLAPENVERRVSLFRPDTRLAGVKPAFSPAHHDTTYLTVVDAEGTMVSFINSIFDDFGSGILAPESGILLHNRGCGFTLEPGHPNAISGRRRPMHTIIPAMLTRDGEAVMSFGVTGAHFQPLGQIQVLTNMLDHGMRVQEALDAPRMFAHGDTLQLESRVPTSVWDGLRSLGHVPIAAPNPLGTGQAIWLDRSTRLLCGGADPRRDGIALGF